MAVRFACPLSRVNQGDPQDAIQIFCAIGVPLARRTKLQRATADTTARPATSATTAAAGTFPKMTVVLST